MEHKLSVTPVAEGSSNIVTASRTSVNYIKPVDVSVTAKVAMPTDLAHASPAKVKEIVQKGLASATWAVGDLTAGIPMYGTVGRLLINGTWHARLIGLDHNKALESANKSNAHFELPTNADGTSYAFTDEPEYFYKAVAKGAQGLAMNPEYYQGDSAADSTVGGWRSSYARVVLMPQFYNTLPNNWRSIISPCTKYTDNVGNNAGDSEAAVTATNDNMFLPSAYEYCGIVTSPISSFSANLYESKSQKRYTYYSISFTTRIVHYRHNDPAQRSGLWTRSVYKKGNTCFGYQTLMTSSGKTGETIMQYQASYSRAMAPCFQVA